MSRHTSRHLVAAASAVGLVLASGAMASAHVTVTPSTTAAGAYTVLTFSAGHGCDGSPTTTVTVQIPEEIVTVTPTVNPNWTVTKKMEKLDTPADDGHGGQYTERVAHVVYTAKTPLADGYRDTFELSLRLPEQAGDKLVFPVIQTCVEGETAWTQTYEEGQDEPESPAPFLTLTAAEDSADGHGANEDEAAAEDDGSGVLGWSGVVLGALGLVAGGAALARGRESS